MHGEQVNSPGIRCIDDFYVMGIKLNLKPIANFHIDNKKLLWGANNQ